MDGGGAGDGWLAVISGATLPQQLGVLVCPTGGCTASRREDWGHCLCCHFLQQGLAGGTNPGCAAGGSEAV